MNKAYRKTFAFLLVIVICFGILPAGTISVLAAPVNISITSPHSTVYKNPTRIYGTLSSAGTQTVTVSVMQENTGKYMSIAENGFVDGEVANPAALSANSLQWTLDTSGMNFEKGQRFIISVKAHDGVEITGSAGASFKRLDMPDVADKPWNYIWDTIVPGILRDIVPPTITGGDFDVMDYGAVADGVAGTATVAPRGTDNKPAFDAALAACKAAGGGRVVVPAGRYFVDGPVWLDDNTDFHIAEGATLYFSTNPASYPSVLVRWEGTRCYNYSPLIYAYQKTNIVLSGKGVIDGGLYTNTANPWYQMYNSRITVDGWANTRQTFCQTVLRAMGQQGLPLEERQFGYGATLKNNIFSDAQNRTMYAGTPLDAMRPPTIEFYECKNVLVKDVSVLRSPFWTSHYPLCENVTIDGITVNPNNAMNDDACNPDGTKNMLIQNCDFWTTDDNIAVKAGRDNDAWELQPTQNIVIRNNTFRQAGSNNICMGSEMSGGVFGVYAYDNHVITGGSSVLYVKADTDRGGEVAQIYFKDITCDRGNGRAIWFQLNYQGRTGGPYPANYYDIYFDNIQMGSCNYGIIYEGLDRQSISNVYFNNVVIDQVRMTGANNILRTDYTTDLYATNLWINNVQYPLPTSVGFVGTVPVAMTPADSGGHLKRITVNGVPVEGFAMEKDTYTVKLPAGEDPLVVATPNVPSSTAVVTYTEDAATIKVTAKDTSITKTYTINFDRTPVVPVRISITSPHSTVLNNPEKIYGTFSGGAVTSAYATVRQENTGRYLSMAANGFVNAEVKIPLEVSGTGWTLDTTSINFEKGQRFIIEVKAVNNGVVAGSAGASFIRADRPYLNDKPWDYVWDVIVPEIEAYIVAPTFKDQDFIVTDYGAAGDYTGVVATATNNKPAFDAAIAACVTAGGGRVVVPPGNYLINGPIWLENDMNLHVMDGATLTFAYNPQNYPNVLVRWEGTRCYNYSPLIYAYQKTNVAVTGKGKICGNTNAGWVNMRLAQEPSKAVLRAWGQAGTPLEERQLGYNSRNVNLDTGQTIATDQLRPTTIEFYECQNVLVEDVLVYESPFWTTHYVFCDNVTVRGLRIEPGGIMNDDGCNPDGTSNMLIENCTFSTLDDNIAVKAGRDNDAWELKPTENIIIRNCEFASTTRGNNVCMGSEMSGGIFGVYVYDCHVGLAQNSALYLKADTNRGGEVAQIYFKDIVVENAPSRAIWFQLNYQGMITGPYPANLYDTYFDNIHVKSAGRGIIYEGLSRQSISNVYFNDVVIERATNAQKILTTYTTNIRANNLWIDGVQYPLEGKIPEYMVPRDSGAMLKALTVNGVSVKEFKKDKISYSVTLPNGNTPSIVAVPNVPSSTAVVALTADSAVITVTAKDTSITKTYTITFSYVDRLFEAEVVDGKVHVSFLNGSDNPIDGVFVIGIYDGARMVDVYMFEFEAGANSPCTAIIDLALNSAYTYKAFCWDDDYIPLSPAIILN